MATSFVLTFTYIMSGMVEQPTVGDFIARTQLKVMNHAAGLSAVQSWFLILQTKIAGTNSILVCM